MPVENLEAYLTASVMAEVESRGMTYAETEDMVNAIKLSAKFLTEPKYKFGIIFMGMCGNGKTTIMRAIASIINYSNFKSVFGEKAEVEIRSAKDINIACKDDESKAHVYSSMPMLGIDDMGSEATEVLSYGNAHTPITDILERRYNKRLWTMVTTNCTPQQIRERYGARIADRLNEMTVVVAFKGKSNRK